MMCYNYHGPLNKQTVPNASLRSSDNLNVELCINYLLRIGSPAEKFAIGRPLFGHTFVLEDPTAANSNKNPQFRLPAKTIIGFLSSINRQSRFVGYNEICLELTINDSFIK